MSSVMLELHAWCSVLEKFYINLNLIHAAFYCVCVQICDHLHLWPYRSIYVPHPPSLHLIEMCTFTPSAILCIRGMCLWDLFELCTTMAQYYNPSLNVKKHSLCKIEGCGERYPKNIIPKYVISTFISIGTDCLLEVLGCEAADGFDSVFLCTSRLSILSKMTKCASTPCFSLIYIILLCL